MKYMTQKEKRQRELAEYLRDHRACARAARRANWLRGDKQAAAYYHTSALFYLSLVQIQIDCMVADGDV